MNSNVGVPTMKLNSDKNLAKLDADDKLALGHMRYAQGPGASLRYFNELRAVQQTGRLPFLKSSNLHEDVLRGNLSAGSGLWQPLTSANEEAGSSRLAHL